MGTHSFIINKCISWLIALNRWYERSIFQRAVSTLKRGVNGSVIVTGFLRPEFVDYWENSAVLRMAAFLGRGAAGIVYKALDFLKWANEHSLNRRFFLWLFALPGRVVRSLPPIYARAAATCSPVRLISWFFSEGNAAFWKTFYMIFIVGVLIIPGPWWRNYILFAAAVLVGVVLFVKKQLALSQVSPALMAFLFFCAISVFTGYGGMESARTFIIFLSCAMHSFYVAAILKDIRDLRLFFKIIATVLAALAFFGFFVMLFIGIEARPDLTDLIASPGLIRLYSTLGNPNVDAKAWALLFPFALVTLFTVKGDGRRVFLSLAVALFAVAFLLTYSRAGYVALAAGLAVFILMAAPRLVPVALVALILALPLIPSGVIDRLLTLGTDTSSLYRFSIWRGVLHMLGDYWATGIGMGHENFTRVYIHYAEPIATVAVHAHNTFLDIVVHSGVVALVAFLIYKFRLFRRAIATHVASSDVELKLYTAASVASLATFMVFSVGEYMLFEPRVALMFWVAAGICTAATNLAAQKDTK